MACTWVDGGTCELCGGAGQSCCSLYDPQLGAYICDCSVGTRSSGGGDFSGGANRLCPTH